MAGVTKEQMKKEIAGNLFSLIISENILWKNKIFVYLRSIKIQHMLYRHLFKNRNL